MDVNQHLFSWTPQTIVNLLIAGGFKVESLARVPMSMRSFLLRRGLAPGGAFDALMFLSDRLRLGTCPGEMVVTARRVGPRSASFP
jgi:hypothetical protein